ncbi:MAG: GAF domain-containing protein, partial [Actinomycetota bacterium]
MPLHRAAPFSKPPYIALVLMVAFAATEIFVVHLELKRDAHSISLSEIPLAIGLFFVHPLLFMASRIIGSTASLVFHRKQRGVKLAFNVANFVLETSVAVTVFGLLRPASGFSWMSYVAAIVALATVNVITACTVTVAIGISQGRIRTTTLRQILTAGSVAGLMNAVIGAVIADTIHLSARPGWGLLFPAALSFLGYRGYASLSQRHSRLRKLYEYVRAIRRSPELDGSIGEMLTHAREMLSADRAELWLYGDGQSRCFSLRGDQPLAVGALPAGGPWSPDSERPMVIPRSTKDPHERALLDSVGTSDLVVAAVRDEQRVIGTLLVAGRLGDIA